MRLKRAARALEATGSERSPAEAIAAQTVTRTDLEALATRVELRWMFGFQAALVVAMAARLCGLA